MSAEKKRKAKAPKKTTLVVVGQFTGDVMFVVSDSIYNERGTIGMPKGSANFAALRILSDKVIEFLNKYNPNFGNASPSVLVLEDGKVLVVCQGNGVGLLSPEEYTQAAEESRSTVPWWERFEFSEIVVG